METSELFLFSGFLLHVGWSILNQQTFYFHR
ncbi:MAG: hypothetical protein KatS3mg048_1966 [Caldilinea sp.]|nr:MAG: hypothetical protein KatS3mg048_1966 [Caldilinea sp.]